MIRLHSNEMKLIRGMPLFRGVEAPHLSALLSSARTEHYDVAQPLFSQGDQATDVFVLLQGGLENHVTDKTGRQSTFRIIQDGPVLAYPSVPGQCYHAVGCRAFVHSRVAAFEMGVFTETICHSPTLAEGLFKELCLIENDITEHLADLKGRSSLQRLAGFLARQTNSHEGPANVRLPILKQNLASMIGVVPEKLSRDFSRLADFGVRSRGRDIIIKDVRRLWQLYEISTKAIASNRHASA